MKNYIDINLDPPGVAANTIKKKLINLDPHILTALIKSLHAANTKK
jgi:hypothetical protein